MDTELKVGVPLGQSLKSLAAYFVITKQSEGKSPKTVSYYHDNLRRFLWYCDQQQFSDDIRLITQWQVKQFLAYVGSAKDRWGLTGTESQTSKLPASQATVRHYYVVLSCFFNWVVAEGFLSESPMAKIKVNKPKPKVITPYSPEEMNHMLAVCDQDFGCGAKFLGSRNRALLLVFLDSGIRLSEMAGMRLDDVNSQTGEFKVTGKGDKQRFCHLGVTARKALWKYLMFRPGVQCTDLWLTEESQPMALRGIQSAIESLKKRAGVKGSGNVHRFRHSFALNFLRADKNVFNLQYLLGHSDLDMVRRYTSALGMQDAIEAHRKSSPADMMKLK
ncbi:integrase/recombinase XerD [Dehalogenimonas formicexedens]|uniref:Integrase/recombinase XerD n=1 Tax=Dehalogenimonas formicexedens TaxID=1839801 RepID=A0A1P8F6U6_9CHLR|nr:tyrosine-type recombinase/integrase [Dehalogenimonas formicexedens]APV44168.1 integrase/recombinase XerD [Dehalogenimonas formicexedens]